jgi:hypothetical protein
LSFIVELPFSLIPAKEPNLLAEISATPRSCDIALPHHANNDAYAAMI